LPHVFIIDTLLFLLINFSLEAAMRTQLMRIAIVGAALIAGATSAAAFPERTVRIVVPFAPGGVTDIAARVIGQQLATRWKKSVVIENKAGGGGLIGMDAVRTADADGHTLLMATNGELVVKPTITAKMPFEPSKVFVSIGAVASTPYLWAAHSKSGIDTIAALVAAARAKPGHLAYSSAGYGTTMHMASEQFAAATGIQMLHVPYRGGAPAAAAIIAGEVPVGLVGTNSIDSVAQSGAAKLLAVTSRTRLKVAPNVPTISETGLAKGFEATVWAGLFAPQGTPPDILSQVQRDVAAALKERELIQKFESMGIDVGVNQGQAFERQIESEKEAMALVAKHAKIKLE
jgi:tripartite-type tricarboxylate transporter receptor subunit TctC